MVARVKVEAENNPADDHAEVPATDLTNESSSDSSQTEDNRLDELRYLLFGKEQSQLNQLEEKINETSQRTELIRDVLPQAIVKSVKQDEQLKEALTPTVVDIIRTSINRDVKTFADALFPVIGPAIRKSIAEALKEMVQSMNTVMDRSFSPQGIKWRIESMRTGQSFAEIALLNSLLYRVEQVFLIQKESGLVIKHLASDPDVVEDADLVSAMLTAIRDFVNDSFKTGGGRSLESIKVGEFSVWIEQGPHAILACAIRGSAAVSFRQQMIRTLEEMHTSSAELLHDFNGDTSELEPALFSLEELLQTHTRDKKDDASTAKKKPQPFLILLGVILLGVVAWSIYSWIQQSRLNEFVQQLEAKQGIAVLSVSEENGRTLVKGMRDPHAENPETILSGSHVKEDSVRLLFEPYLSLEPEMVLARARQKLNPPDSVKISLQDNVLNLSGRAPNNWIQQSQTVFGTIIGVDSVEQSSLVNFDLEDLAPPSGVILELEKDILRASGVAPYLWITQTRNKVAAIEGSLQYDDSELQNRDLNGLNPPETVSLKFESDRLSAEGEAPYGWIMNTRAAALNIAGISKYDDSRLANSDYAALAPPDSVSLVFDENNLTVTGIADYNWLQQFNEKSANITGIQNIDVSGLMIREKVEFEQQVRNLASFIILFDKAEASDFVDHTSQLNEVISTFQSITELSSLLGYPEPYLEIIGHTDSSGSLEYNKTLSQERADFIKTLLIEQGLDADKLIAKGVADQQPVATSSDADNNRSVTFLYINTQNNE